MDGAGAWDCVRSSPAGRRRAGARGSPTHGVPQWPMGAQLQRRDLQLPGDSPPPGWRRCGVPRRVGHRGPRAGDRPLGTRRRPRCHRRHVLLCAVGPPAPPAPPGPRPVWREAALLRVGRPALRLRFGVEGRLSGPRVRRGDRPRRRRALSPPQLRAGAPHDLSRGGQAAPRPTGLSGTRLATGLASTTTRLLVGPREHRRGASTAGRGEQHRTGRPTGGSPVGLGGRPHGGRCSGGCIPLRRRRLHDDGCADAAAQPPPGAYVHHRVRQPVVRRVGPRRRGGRAPGYRPHPADRERRHRRRHHPPAPRHLGRAVRGRVRDPDAPGEQVGPDRRDRRPFGRRG